MNRFVHHLIGLAFATSCGAVLAAGPVVADGVARGDAAPPSAVKLVLPRCADPGTVIQIEVRFPDTFPADVSVTLTEPTTGDPYLLEQKINKRHFDGDTTATLHYFYVDPYSQIVGTAKVKAVVTGVGSGSGSFQIPC